MTHQEYLIRHHDDFKPYRSAVVECMAIIIENKLGTHLHHIIPKSLGGSDDRQNLIRLSVRRHVKLHKILAECFIKNGDCLGRQKSIYSYLMMDEEWHLKGAPLHECDIDYNEPKLLSELMDGVIKSMVERSETREFMEKELKLSFKNKARRNDK